MTGLGGFLRSEAIGQGLVVATKAAVPEARIAACQALGRHGNSDHVFAIAARLGETYWQVEIAAVRTLQAIGGPRAVNVLVTAMDRTEGRVREAVNAALHQLTGEDFHCNPVQCKQWWDRHRELYKDPPDRSKKSTRPPQDPPLGPAVAGYFGIQTRSRRIVFVLEASAAMHLPMGKALIVVGEPDETRFDSAMTRLIEAIEQLPEGTGYNVVFYNEKIKVWKSKKSRSRVRNREFVRKWMADAKPAGAAAVHDALVQALDRSGREPHARLRATAPDTVFLIAGGPTSAGSLAFEADIVDEIEHLNRLCQATIHTVAVGTTAPNGFLRALAARCAGRFVKL